MSILKRYNKPEIAILALAAFLFLARYSLDHDYTQQQVDSMAKLVAESQGTMTNAEKLRYLYVDN